MSSKAAFGWWNYHLHEFEVDGTAYGVPDPDDDWGPPVNDERKVRLDTVAHKGSRIEYIYDFGDHWSHIIKIVKPMPAAPGVAYPLLIDAVGRCPLEDSGGPPGYMDLIEALHDPSHPRHSEALDWPGPGFDPTATDSTKLEKDVADLAKQMTPRRPRPTKAKPKARRTSDDGHF